MKIGIFTECYKPILNGVVNSIIGFKKGLTKLGHEVYIFCPNYKDYKPESKKIIYCNSWPIPGKSGYHFIFPLSKKIKEIAQNMDIIHVQHPFVMGDRAADAAEEFNLPLAFTNHTQYEQYAHYIPISKEIIIRSIEWYIQKFSKRVNLIIAPAPGIVRVLNKYKVSTPIEIVPNGIDVKRFKKQVSQAKIDQLRQKYTIDPSKKVLIFIGRIAEEKNLTFLLRAFAKLIANKLDLYLMLVGGGPQMEHFNSLIKELKLEKKAIITDYVPYEQMPSYLALGYLYVTASKSEVHPLTILEGLASGLPMIIVDAPGTGDIITNNKDGLVAKNNINDFVAKIIKLLDDRKLYNKLSVGAKITAQKYSYLATSKQMLRAYQQAIRIHNNKM